MIEAQILDVCVQVEVNKGNHTRVEGKIEVGDVWVSMQDRSEHPDHKLKPYRLKVKVHASQIPCAMPFEWDYNIVAREKTDWYHIHIFEYSDREEVTKALKEIVSYFL